MKQRIAIFRDKKLPDEIVSQTFGLADNRDWKMSKKRKAIIDDENWEKKIHNVLYRPFDLRWIFYLKDAIDFGRLEVMRHMIGEENMAMLISRRASQEWQHCLVTDNLAVDIAISTASREANQFFPLWLYADADKRDLFSELAKGAKRKSNLDPTLLEAFKRTYDYVPDPEEIFYYIYAVLYTPSYRTKYAEFLRTDFPRIPFTKNKGLFAKLASFGKILVRLHLLKSSELDRPICRLQGRGNNRIDKPGYNAEESRVYINKTQYFEGVEPEVWKYKIGGYQVLDKWLNERQERPPLNAEDIKHYCRVVTALAKTREIQQDIDELYSQVEKDVVPIAS